jgi:hypothetical protein
VAEGHIGDSLSHDPEFQGSRGKGKRPTPFFSWKLRFPWLFYIGAFYLVLLAFIANDVTRFGGLTVIHIMPLYCVGASGVIIYLMDKVLKS